MGYLSNHILKHSATYTPLNKQNIDGYGTLRKDEAVTLSKVYITRYTSQVITNNNLIVPFGDMLLFYDLIKSQPTNLTFQLDEIITFNDSYYRIIDIHNAFGSHIELQLQRINND